MLDDSKMMKDLEDNYQEEMEGLRFEEDIIMLFKKLQKHRQKAILSELWSEFKPEKQTPKKRFYNLPY